MLAAANIVHFDLKCDNVLLDFIQPAPAPPALPFRTVLADFGTARQYASVQAAHTTRQAPAQRADPHARLLVCEIRNWQNAQIVAPCRASATWAQPLQG